MNDTITREMMIRHISDGMSQRQIAAHYGVSEATISLRAKRFGLRNDILKKYLNKDEFGGVIPIEFLGRDRNGHAEFTCRCHCGTLFTVKGNALDTKNTKSCGCLKRVVGNKHHSFKGYQEISMVYWLAIKSGAQRRNITFDITIESAWEVYLKQNRRCALTGREIVFGKSFQDGKNRTASLDRINSSLGYTMDNIQWLHKQINMMKRSDTDEEFIRTCQEVVKFNKGKC